MRARTSTNRAGFPGRNEAEWIPRAVGRVSLTAQEVYRVLRMLGISTAISPGDVLVRELRNEQCLFSRFLGTR